MGFLIEGKPGSRFSKEKGWEAYMPIKLKDDSLYLTLATNERVTGKDGCFYLYTQSGSNVARCDFPSGHKYMHIYRDLLQTLNKSIKTEQVIEPQMFKEPMEITDRGYVSAYAEKKFSKSLGVNRKELWNDNNKLNGR